MKVFELQELESATDNFSPSRLIGKGSHGSVYRGVLEDGTQIAVKKQSTALQNLQDNTKLENEARILYSLSPYDNPCIIDFLGTTGAEKPIAIVTEYMPNGTLHENLHSSIFINNRSPPQQLLKWRTRLDIAVQLARGVRFLHEVEPAVVHRDIKSSNILLDGNWNAKLADFGLAMRLRCNININNDDDDMANKLPAGTIGYIDPSYTSPSDVSTKIDVFSYGVVLLELISGRRAIDMDKSPASIVDWALPLIEQGRGMDVCDEKIHWPVSLVGGRIDELLQLAARCVSVEQNSRPSMGEIVGILEGLSILEPIVRAPPLSMNYVYGMIVSMMRRKLGFGGTKLLCGDEMVSKSSKCACANDDGGDDGANMSKGTLLVKEILADITLK